MMWVDVCGGLDWEVGRVRKRAVGLYGVFGTIFCLNGLFRVV